MIYFVLLEVLILHNELLNSFYPEKVFQEKGVGWRLFSYFLDSLPVMTEVILEVDQENKKAINLYRKAGFFKIGLRKKYYNDGSDALVMKFIN